MYINFKLQKQLSVSLVIKLSTADLLFICLQFPSNEQSRQDFGLAFSAINKFSNCIANCESNNFIAAIKQSN